MCSSSKPDKRLLKINYLKCTLNETFNLTLLQNSSVLLFYNFKLNKLLFVKCFVCIGGVSFFTTNNTFFDILFSNGMTFKQLWLIGYCIIIRRNEVSLKHIKQTHQSSACSNQERSVMVCFCLFSDVCSLAFKCSLSCLLSNRGRKNTERCVLYGRLGNQTLLRGECDFHTLCSHTNTAHSHTHVTLWLSLYLCVWC